MTIWVNMSMLKLAISKKNSKEFKAIDKTKAFNFQQGSMINWIYSNHEEKLNL